jgi:hypothetical protein
MDYGDFQDIIFFGSLVSNISDYELYHITVSTTPYPRIPNPQSPNLCKNQDAHSMRTASPWAASPRRNSYDPDRMIFINFTH